MARQLDEGPDSVGDLPRSTTDFEPPLPPRTSVLEVVAGAAFVLIAAPFYRPLKLIARLIGPFVPSESADESHARLAALDAEIKASTAPPRVTAAGTVLCTRCSAAVAFRSMALNEHGYFCRACASP